jgi:hypothetical protein
LLRDILWIHNLEGLMGRMAEQTVSLRHLFCVWLMALHALRSISVPRMMTGVAIKFRMLRYICLHLLVYLWMAYVTAMLQGAVGRNVEWCVYLRVACGTLGQLGTVNFLVTRRTLWKDVFVFYLIRAIDVKCLMAFHTVYPVFATLGSYKLVKVRMTPPTLLWLHGLYPRCIHGWKILFLGPFRRWWCSTSQETWA